ncbi:hypothetical protein PoB_005868700 [Plakobranchus ocellatus]|uniref:Uncharacterized protein n=1 Tax=Plakobranchus ocellatus TaxID=259542 RepID=A0AAV4CKU1_9GAST|nr:hypothetical protein PoB_005868700 [Plakobranchus ocellatus]
MQCNCSAFVWDTHCCGPIWLGESGQRLPRAVYVEIRLETAITSCSVVGNWIGYGSPTGQHYPPGGSMGSMEKKGESRKATASVHQTFYVLGATSRAWREKKGGTCLPREMEPTRDPPPSL